MKVAVNDTGNRFTKHKVRKFNKELKIVTSECGHSFTPTEIISEDGKRSYMTGGKECKRCFKE